MDFFKSVFSTDPTPSDPPPHQPEEPDSDGEDNFQSQTASDVVNPEEPYTPPASGTDGGESKASVWGFGGLIKTLASKSETVILTYRRDLEEFGSGLKKETAAIREAATRAVRDLPVSLETGASVAQESLESVGQAIDDLGGTVWRGTTEIITQGKEALLSVDSDAEASDASVQQNPGSSRRYSRFEVQVLGTQSDQNTFLEDSEDSEDYQAWRDGFRMEEKEGEVEELCAENAALEGMLEKLVPQSVDYETFWSRYFYKVYKLKQAEDARAKLVKRVISREEEEEDLSWEVDDDEEEEGGAQEVATEDGKEGQKEELSNVSRSEREIVETSEAQPVEEKPTEKSQVENVVEVAPVENAENVELERKVESSKLIVEDPVETATKPDDKPIPDGKAEPVESCKDSDISVVSSQPSMPEEDDLGWDEIEDLGENDEKRSGASSESSNKIDLCKRLSVAEDEEDLSWDIEDD